MWYQSAQVNWLQLRYSDFSMVNCCSCCQIHSGWRTTKQLFQAENWPDPSVLELPLVGWLAAAFFPLFAPPVLLTCMLSVPYSCTEVVSSATLWFSPFFYGLKRGFRPCFWGHSNRGLQQRLSLRVEKYEDVFIQINLANEKIVLGM